MNAQQAYEKIRKHFSRPNAIYGFDPATNRCVYRAELKNGKIAKCAVGCLIPKRNYAEDFEDCTIQYDWIEQALGTPIERRTFEFLKLAQTIHDNCAKYDKPMEEFIANLDIEARVFKLKVPNDH